MIAHIGGIRRGRQLATTVPWACSTSCQTVTSTSASPFTNARLYASRFAYAQKNPGLVCPPWVAQPISHDEPGGSQYCFRECSKSPHNRLVVPIPKAPTVSRPMCPYHLNNALRRESRFEELSFRHVRLRWLRQLRVGRAWVYGQNSRGLVKTFQFDAGCVQ